MVTNPSEPCHRYRLHVLAATATEVVTAIGGWLFDQAKSGWDVHAHLLDPGDPRPLHILGVQSGHLDPARAVDTATGPAAGVAVSTHLYESDLRVRAAVGAALRDDTVTVALWGDRCPAALERRMRSRTVHVSAAAAAFKRQALVAAHGGVRPPLIAVGEEVLLTCVPASQVVTPLASRVALRDARPPTDHVDEGLTRNRLRL